MNKPGSRIYQLVLKRMQLHPSNRLSLNVARPLRKGKKRADDTGSDDEDGSGTNDLLPSPPKKSRVGNNTDDASMADAT